MPDARDFHMKILSLPLRHRTDHGVHGGDQAAEGKLLQGQHHFPALNLGDIQNIVDETKKMLTGGHDFPGIIPHLVRILRLPGKQRRKPQNRIHGSPDIMGHI